MLVFSNSTPEAEERVKALLSELERVRQRKVFCFYQDQDAGETIGLSTVTKVRKALREIEQTDELCIFLDSPGGDIDCAFRIARCFRRHAGNIEVLVVDWAKSAATFLCLSANKIFMGRDAELGPLDALLPDPRGGIKPLSALDVFKSLEFLNRYALEVLDRTVLLLMRRTRMDIPYALEAARPLVSYVIEPLYRQVKPLELGGARRLLAIGEKYSKIVMSQYGYTSLSEEAIDRIVQELVWNYPSHGFVIDLEEAQRLGLNAELLDDASTALCEEILSEVGGCFGFISNGDSHE